MQIITGHCCSDMLKGLFSWKWGSEWFCYHTIPKMMEITSEIRIFYTYPHKLHLKFRDTKPHGLIYIKLLDTVRWQWQSHINCVSTNKWTQVANKKAANIVCINNSEIRYEHYRNKNHFNRFIKYRNLSRMTYSYDFSLLHFLTVESTWMSISSNIYTYECIGKFH